MLNTEIPHLRKSGGSGDYYSSIKADSVLVLPKNYGWEARVDGDKIWGIYAAMRKCIKFGDCYKLCFKSTASK
jgi:hypothetical protein